MISAQLKCMPFAHITVGYCKKSTVNAWQVLFDGAMVPRHPQGETTPFFDFSQKGNKRNNEKNKDFHESKAQDSRALWATSRVVLELKPFGILIRGPIVSEPWVGRNTGKMSGNSSVQGSRQGSGTTNALEIQQAQKRKYNEN